MGSGQGRGESISRRRLMALGGGAAAVAATGALLSACGEDSEAQEASRFGDGDVGILNYALTLEHLQSDFYSAAASAGLFRGADQRTIREFGKDEEEHIEALRELVAQLGGKPAVPPRTSFPLQSPQAALQAAATIEKAAANAYLGQVPNLEDPAALEKALAIHTVEGRHSAAVETRLGRSITPDGPFAKPATVAATLKAVEPFMES